MHFILCFLFRQPLQRLLQDFVTAIADALGGGPDIDVGDDADTLGFVVRCEKMHRKKVFFLYCAIFCRVIP